MIGKEQLLISLVTFEGCENTYTIYKKVNKERQMPYHTNIAMKEPTEAMVNISMIHSLSGSTSLLNG
jgi:hypothetical protein